MFEQPVVSQCKITFKFYSLDKILLLRQFLWNFDFCGIIVNEIDTTAFKVLSIRHIELKTIRLLL